MIYIDPPVNEDWLNDRSKKFNYNFGGFELVKPPLNTALPWYLARSGILIGLRSAQRSAQFIYPLRYESLEIKRIWWINILRVFMF